jgi:hypothetical protein
MAAAGEERDARVVTISATHGAGRTVLAPSWPSVSSMSPATLAMPLRTSDAVYGRDAAVSRFYHLALDPTVLGEDVAVDLITAAASAFWTHAEASRAVEA